MNTRHFELFLLGCSAALPAYGRYPSAQLLNIHGQWMLIDCGEGTQFQLNKYDLPRAKISKIFISHLHGDHIFGLPGLLTSYQLQDRKLPIEIFGPPGLKALISKVLGASHSRIAYKINIHEIEDFNAAVIYEDEHFLVKSLPMDHSVPCMGFHFQEKSYKLSLNIARLLELNIPVAQWSTIEQGASIDLPSGINYSNELLTTDSKPLRSYAYCSDTKFKAELAGYIKAVDLLYHEATFLEADKDKAADRGHSTAAQAARIAKAAHARKLLLGHFSSRYKDLKAFKIEADTVFEDSWIGIEGLSIRFPNLLGDSWEITQVEEIF